MSRAPNKVFIVKSGDLKGKESRHPNLSIVTGEIISGSATFGGSGDSDNDDERDGGGAGFAFEFGLGQEIKSEPKSRRSSTASVGNEDSNNVLEELRLLNAKVEEIERMLDYGQWQSSVHHESATTAVSEALPLSDTFDATQKARPQGHSHSHLRRPTSVSLTNSKDAPDFSEGDDLDREGSQTEMFLDEVHLAELRTLRNELRTALWTVDSSRPSRTSRSGSARFYRDPPPSLAPTISTVTSTSSPSGVQRSSRSRATTTPRLSQRQRRGSAVSERSISSSGSSGSRDGISTTFLERLRDRCVAYFSTLAHQQVCLLFFLRFQMADGSLA